MRKGSLESHVLILSSGTGLGLALVVLTTPLITRLYTPEQFGHLSVFLSILSITSVLSCLRYDWAIPLPKDNKVALSLLILCVLLAIITTFLFFIIIIIGGEWIVEKTHIQPLKPFLFLMPLFFLFIGLFNIFSFWAVRQKSFLYIAQSRFFNNLVLVVIQIGLGILHAGTIGLLIGDLSGKLVGAVIMVGQCLKDLKKTSIKVTKTDIIAAARRYHRFPLISGLSTLINSSGLKLPVIISSIMFGANTAGLFSLSQYVFATPMVLIGNSITQVFVAEASKLVKDDPELLLRRFYQASKKLLLLSILIGIAAQLCPFFFGKIFSSAWNEAGVYIQILSVLFVIQFIVSPLSHLTVHELQHWQLFWDILRLMTMTGSFLYAYLKNFNPRQTILLYGILMSVTYIVLYFLNIQAIKRLIQLKKSST